MRWEAKIYFKIAAIAAMSAAFWALCCHALGLPIFI